MSKDLTVGEVYVFRSTKMIYIKKVEGEHYFKIQGYNPDGFLEDTEEDSHPNEHTVGLVGIPDPFLHLRETNQID